MNISDELRASLLGRNSRFDGVKVPVHWPRPRREPGPDGEPPAFEAAYASNGESDVFRIVDLVKAPVTSQAKKRITMKQVFVSARNLASLGFSTGLAAGVIAGVVLALRGDLGRNGVGDASASIAAGAGIEALMVSATCALGLSLLAGSLGYVIGLLGGLARYAGIKAGR